MEDFEVRQALEVIKQRVAEMKKVKEQDWKENLAEEYNAAVKEDRRPADGRSEVSYGKSLQCFFC